MTQTTAAHGSWSSPVTADELVGDTVRLAEVRVDHDDVYWLEGRPRDGGRVVLVRRTSDGARGDVTPEPFNVRSRVHEYGGGAYTVHDGQVVFANFSDQRLYRIDVGSDTSPRPITPEEAFRYGDLRIDPARPHVICVREDHREDGREPVNTLVWLSLDGPNDEGGRVLVEGTDFVSSPALSGGSTRLAWITWDHPNMSWDGSTLWAGDLDDEGGLSHVRGVAGSADEAVSEPRWAPDGRLVFLSDRTGWSNLYAATIEGDEVEIEALLPRQAEFGEPGWMLGASTYGFADGGRLLCTWLDQGIGRVGALELASGSMEPLDTGATSFEGLVVAGETVVFLAGFPQSPSALVRIHLNSAEQEQLCASAQHRVGEGFVSVAERVDWTNARGQMVHGFFYAPTNADFVAPEGELPPMLVRSHGGPTGMSDSAYEPGLQFWTSRGFAVLAVNYGGSAGYGRDYRERLKGNWGVVDVEDCASGAEAMARQGRVDPSKLAIRGGSAGGYTTLCALTFTEVFAAGVSHFGIGDLETLARDTHKFESRYCDGLVGPYPDARDVYVARSPIHHVEQVSCPILLLQGSEDAVVPPNQAQSMADAVRAKGLPVGLVMFEGEGHGFRQAANIKKAIQSELYFYGRVFGFDPADDLEPVHIYNL